MTLSLVVTCYNSTDHLQKFFKWMSLANNFFHEVIIIDDSSSDRTYDVIIEESAKFNNFIVKQREKNSGRPSLPRNDGIEIATGKRIVFLDIDDLIPLSYLDFLAKTNSRDCFSGTKSTIGYSDYESSYKCNLEKNKKISKFRLLNKNHITFSGSSIPIDVAKKYNFINQPLEDWDYWKRIAYGETDVNFVKFSDVPIYYDQNLSLSPKKTRQILRVLRETGILKLPLYFIETIILRIHEYRCGKVFKQMDS